MTEFVSFCIEPVAARSPIQCRAGCFFCCYLPVAVSAPEALLIAAYLRDTIPEPELITVMEQVRATVGRVRPLTIEAHAEAKIPCSLLKADGHCSVYPVRPVKCRGWTSHDRDRCETAFHGSPWRETVPVNMFILALGNGTADGLKRGLGAATLDECTYELNSAILRALETPDAATRWVQGEDVFAGCQSEKGGETKKL